MDLLFRKTRALAVVVLLVVGSLGVRSWGTVRITAATVLGPLALAGSGADTILHGGTVLTMEDNQPVAEALAVQGEKILAVGSNEQILTLKTDKTKVINLEGKTLVPAFVDAHTHVFNDAKKYLNKTLDEAQQLALENGITTLANMYVGPTFMKEIQSFAQQGKLRIRTSLYLVYNTPGGVVESYLGNWYKQYRPTRQPGEILRIGGVKIYADGGSVGKPALSFGPSKGDLWLTQAQLDQIVADAQATGYQVVIHAIGDRAIEQAQNAIQSALAGKPNTPRHRIDHNVYIRPDLLPRYGQIGIVTTIFGNVPTSLINAGRFYWSLEQQTWFLAYRALLDTNPGLHVAWHSDYPWWGSIDPLKQLYSMVTHNEVARNGTIYPPPSWLATNTLSVQEAFPMMNIGAAYAIFRDEEVGSLKPGKFADLVVLSGNPLTVDSDAIKDIRVLLTMVGGRVEYMSSIEAFESSDAQAFAGSQSSIMINLSGPTSILCMAIILPLHVKEETVIVCATDGAHTHFSDFSKTTTETTRYYDIFNLGTHDIK